MEIKKAKNLQDYTKLNDFFWKIWKEEFDLDKFDKIDDYKNWINYFIEESGKIISAINIFKTKEWKIHIWRLATLKIHRWKWIWTKVIKYALKDLKTQWETEILLTAEIKTKNYYEKLWFKQIWKAENVWNTQGAEMKLEITNNEK